MVVAFAWKKNCGNQQKPSIRTVGVVAKIHMGHPPKNYNVKIYLKETGCEGEGEWTYSAQVMTQ
jgi:hypothetical protein